MTRAITLRLDDVDHAALEARAREVGVRPGTMARILVREGLSDRPESRDEQIARRKAALDRLVERSRRQPPVDVVALLRESRLDLDPEIRAGRAEP